VPNHVAIDQTVTCRSCGAPGVRVLEQGVVAPFFAQRVLDLRAASLEERLRRLRGAGLGAAMRRGLGGILAGMLRVSPPGRRLLAARAPLLTRIRACPGCTFVGPHGGYAEDQLLGLYRDYRSDRYNRERASFEPAYRRIQAQVGKSQAELDGRLGHVSRLLAAHLDLSAIHSVLDWGGGEGQFVPRELRDRRVYVLDVSSEALVHPGFVRVDVAPAGITFELVQVCHLLEHVLSPRAFLEKVLPHVKPGGYLYLEVPQDRSEVDLERLAEGRPELRHVIHEHLNLFSCRSVRALAGSLGLREVAVEASELDLGWSTMRIVSGLFARTPQ
jgi:SAM-dependent methyltransferase